MVGLTEVRPLTPEQMPIRLKGPTGKLGWMKWEPPPLMSLSVRRGGHMERYKRRKVK